MNNVMKIGFRAALLLGAVYVLASVAGVEPDKRKGCKSGAWQRPDYGNVETGMVSELIQSPGLNPALVGVPLVAIQ